MSFLNNTSSKCNRWTLGLGVMLGLLGCSKATPPATTQNGTPSGVTGGSGMGANVNNSGTAGNPTGGPAATGSGGTPVTGGRAGTTGGAAGTVAGVAGTTAAGTGGAQATAGTGGGAGAGSSGPDTSSFLADCKQGGASWGTPQQSGPCKSGVTTYGVKTTFGPYGVASEYNVGQGFETAGTDDSAFCNAVFIPSFGADPVGSADLMNTHDLAYNLFTVFYPGVMPEGEKFPLITWGNGTCAMPEGYGPLLRYVASFGYIIVAANDRAVGSGASMSKGIDFMLAENDKTGSKYYQKIDKDHIGAMGHSQGGMGTIAVAANDARVKSIIIWNGGSSAAKPFLAVSGDMDLGAGTDPSSLKNSVTAAQQPGAWLWYHQVPQAVNGSTTGTFAPGHLTLMMESERVIEPALAWWDMQFKGKADAKNMFLGASCKLCDTGTYPSMWPPFVGLATPAHEYGANPMLK